MTYFEYHLIFNIPLLVILLYLNRRKLRYDHLKWIGVLLVIVLATTYPWDSNAVSRGIWTFDEKRVALFIGNLPLEEVLFFLFETVIVSLAVILTLPNRESTGTSQPERQR